MTLKMGHKVVAGKKKVKLAKTSAFEPKADVLTSKKSKNETTKVKPLKSGVASAQPVRMLATRKPKSKTQEYDSSDQVADLGEEMGEQIVSGKKKIKVGKTVAFEPKVSAFASKKKKNETAKVKSGVASAELVHTPLKQKLNGKSDQRSDSVAEIGEQVVTGKKKD